MEENNMRENYESVRIEVIRFDAEDVITTSGGGIELPDDPIDG